MSSDSPPIHEAWVPSPIVRSPIPAQALSRSSSSPLPPPSISSITFEPTIQPPIPIQPRSLNHREWRALLPTIHERPVSIPYSLSSKDSFQTAKSRLSCDSGYKVAEMPGKVTDVRDFAYDSTTLTSPSSGTGTPTTHSMNTPPPSDDPADSRPVAHRRTSLRSESSLYTPYDLAVSSPHAPIMDPFSEISPQPSDPPTVPNVRAQEASGAEPERVQLVRFAPVHEVHYVPPYSSDSSPTQSPTTPIFTTNTTTITANVPGAYPPSADIYQVRTSAESETSWQSDERHEEWYTQGRLGGFGGVRGVRGIGGAAGLSVVGIRWWMRWRDAVRPEMMKCVGGVQGSGGDIERGFGRSGEQVGGGGGGGQECGCVVQ